VGSPREKLAERTGFAYPGRMSKKLFLLDGMALVYRAHFAFIRRPIFTSTGVNTSALFGFTNTLLDILNNQEPTHLAVAFDTAAPTQRHVDFPEYKAQREAMPEDISFAIPHVHRLVEAFRIPVLTRDGFEADDIIGTLARRAEREGYESYMVTPDKDFGQLVDEHTHILKPSRAGEGTELLKLPDVLKKWGIERPEQVVDILALMGDTSDNIPGVPAIGEKTAAKLVAQFGSVENLLAHTGDLKGRQKETLEAHREQALLSKRLATILCDVPLEVSLEALKRSERNDEELKRLFIEFEFNSIGKRLFGGDFKAGRGFQPGGEGPSQNREEPASEGLAQGHLFAEGESRSVLVYAPATPDSQAQILPGPTTIQNVAHKYELITTAQDRAGLIQKLRAQKMFCFDTETTSLDPKEARLVGLAFSFQSHTGCFVALPKDDREASAVLEEFRGVLEDESIGKLGHNLKFDLSVLRWNGLAVRGRLLDTMLAHSLVEPDQRHGMDYLSEVYLGYTPVPITDLIGEKKSGQRSMADVPVEALTEYAAEDADVTWQLWERLEPLLPAKGQENVFYQIETPLLPVLVDMEGEGVRVDAAALSDFASQLEQQIAELERTVHRLAGREFNLNSPKQLGEVLFDELKIADAPKKTRTGQYATDEQTLLSLAADHELVRHLLEYRTMTKLKSTYADTLPAAISPKTGRIHTTYLQAITATGRLASQNPNLQNIPVRTELGQEIRKAFVAREGGYCLLSADYSQIELRVIAALSRDPGLLEAFEQGLDIHTATAARVYGVSLEQTTPEMRRQAKMVNFGIIYGISAFGLAQRLGLPRAEAAAIIDQYFKQYPKVQDYIIHTIESARKCGYVETVSGRRRYLRDINSASGTIRSAAERTAINTPIQGSSADMIKLAMVNIHRELTARKLKTRMILQVHDELVFDLFQEEEDEVRALVEEKMRTAIALDVPIVVEMGTGHNWLEAH
jgi:DNA polymerase I